MAEKKSVWRLVKQVFGEFSSDDCSVFAAALAYYATFSLPALLILIIWIASLIWEPSEVSGQIETQMSRLMGKTGAEQVQEMSGQAGVGGGSWSTKVVGVIVLIFGATRMFVLLQQALNKTWDVQPNPDRSGIKRFFLKRLLSLGMILIIASLLLVSLVLSSVLVALSDTISQATPVPGAVLIAANFVISVVVIAMLFAALYKLLPDVKISWQDVWFSASVTSLLFNGGKFLLERYLASQDLDSAYGAAGSLVFVLVWIYYSSMILLLGAEITQVWARRDGDGIEPKEGAVRIVEQPERA